jgi:hypothetical protein
MILVECRVFASSRHHCRVFIVSTTLSFVVHDVRCRVLSMLDDVVDVGRLCLLTLSLLNLILAGGLSISYLSAAGSPTATLFRLQKNQS